MKELGKEKNLREILWDVFMLSVGSLISTSGFVIFVKSNELLSGGIWGISGIINYFFPAIPISALIIIFNIPLLIWGWSKMNTRFALYTMYVVILQSLLIQILPNILPTYSNDIMLACIFGGLFEGAGGGLIVRCHGSSGGTEIAAIIFKEKLDTSPAYLNLVLDALTVTLAGLVFGLERAMYTLIEHFVFSVFFSQVLEGINRGRCLMIVTEKEKVIADGIMKRMGRGVTIMEGRGGWTHRQKAVLYCVVTKLEIATVKEIIRSEDPDAFMCITSTHEIFGKFDKYGKY